MMAAFKSICFITCVSLACSILTPSEYAYASPEQVLMTCEPSVVQAGEIVLLSVTGDIPSGQLSVELFPQRISILSVYPVDRRTLALQLSVPLDAPAGKYNILVYNEHGEEALGKELFEVMRRVRVPKFTSASPTEVDAALSEVQLTLRCDILDHDAIKHLSVEWTVDGSLQEGVTSSFSRGGVNSVHLTLVGEAQSGVALGRIFFDKTPVFLIKLTRVSSDWSLFGHRPARLVSDTLSTELTLLGTELSSTALDGAVATLKSDERSSAPANLECVDKSRAIVKFTSLPAPGDYVLEVEKGGVVVYQGPLILLAGRKDSMPTVDRQAAPVFTQSRSQPAPGSSRRVRDMPPPWQEASAVPPGTTDNEAGGESSGDDTPQSPGDEVPESSGQDAMPQAVHQEATVAEAAVEEDIENEPAVRVTPQAINADRAVLRIELDGLVPEHPDLDRLQVELASAQGDAQLTFFGIGGDGRVIMLFTAPVDGWQVSESYVLSITRKSDGLELCRVSLPVE
jgi:hypothetical protein